MWSQRGWSSFFIVPPLSSVAIATYHLSPEYQIYSTDLFNASEHLDKCEIFPNYKGKICTKNAGPDMAIVGEPCNADAHAKIPALFMPIFIMGNSISSLDA